MSHAGNKLVAKVATRIIKPAGFISVYHGDEGPFFHNQDVGLLPGIGSKLKTRMDLLGIQTAGELAGISDNDISVVFGSRGLLLKKTAKGIDFTPISALPSHLRKIREERTLGTDSSDREELEAHLFLLTEVAGLTLRQNNMLAKGVEVSVIYTDGIKRSGSGKLDRHSFCDVDFFNAARIVLAKILDRRVRVRKITFALTALHEGNIQLDLFIPQEQVRKESLQKTIDSIRKRFGKQAIKVGSVMSEERF